MASATAAEPATYPTTQPPIATQPTVAAPAPASPDPGEQLKNKKAELTKLLSQQTTLQKSLDGLKREVEVLERALGDVEKVVQEYAGALPKLKQDRDDLAAILAEHTKQVEAVLGPKAAQVRNAVDQVDAAIAAALADVTGHEQASKVAELAYAAASEAAAAAEAQFVGLKQVLAGEQKKVKDAVALKDLERKADADNEYKKQCYLLHDLDTALKSLALIDSEPLKSKLNSAVDAVKQTKDATAAAKEASETAKRQLEDARQKQTAAIAGRSAAILTAIQAIP